MTMAAPANRLDTAFAARPPGVQPGIIPYVTAGFPQLNDTPALLLAAQDVGCLAAEIGIPFSDPIADGPTIQATGTRALANGMTPRLALRQIATARRQGVTIPLVLMMYANLILAHGVDDFARDAAEAGADGLIVPDLPDGEAADIRTAFSAHHIALIPMVAPTSPTERIASACAGAGGFVYCVSLAGTTGARASLSTTAISLLERVREVSPLPRALGFGISRHEHLVALTGHAEAVAVGAALLDAIAAEPSVPSAAAGRFLLRLAGGRGGQV